LRGGLVSEAVAHAEGEGFDGFVGVHAEGRVRLGL
jgi:hypothetical protein